jgi:hypothetical protein
MNQKDKQEAADLLGEINKRVNIFLDCLTKKVINSPKNYRKSYVAGLKCLRNNCIPIKIIEASPWNWLGDTAFTVCNRISLCMRSKRGKNKGKLHNLNLLLFVCFHELTHIALPEENHTKKYWKFFSDLLNDGQNCGAINLEDYGISSRYYCGVKIDYNPAFDKSL